MILYRKADMDADELRAASRYFECVPYRTDIKPDSLVIGRYSVLPFYRELEHDIKALGGRLINSGSQHEYIADLRNWVADLGDLTPKTWYRLEDVPKDAGPFVLKGLTNSRKDRWKTHMFAEDWGEMGEVFSRLMDDPLISQQGVAVRQYVPLVEYTRNEITGIPITKEFRFFVLWGHVLCGAYYWSTHIEELGGTPSAEEVPFDFLSTAISRLDSGGFYALDVAQAQSGEWIVIEVNDGQMSGLSENSPEQLYRSMSDLL
jgi:hypothetical protein